MNSSCGNYGNRLNSKGSNSDCNLIEINRSQISTKYWCAHTRPDDAGYWDRKRKHFFYAFKNQIKFWEFVLAEDRGNSTTNNNIYTPNVRNTNIFKMYLLVYWQFEDWLDFLLDFEYCLIFMHVYILRLIYIEQSEMIKQYVETRYVALKSSEGDEWKTTTWLRNKYLENR